jgi:hypothetical protein
VSLLPVSRYDHRRSVYLTGEPEALMSLSVAGRRRSNLGGRGHRIRRAVWRRPPRRELHRSADSRAVSVMSVAPASVGHPVSGDRLSVGRRPAAFADVGRRGMRFGGFLSVRDRAVSEG